MRYDIRLSSAVFCALILTGCQSLSISSSARPDASTVPAITVAQANSCRFIANLTSNSAWPNDSDLYAAAVARAEAQAAEKAGNAIVVHSYQVMSGPNTSAQLEAGVYDCGSAAGGNSKTKM
jgi:hypothetical protein